ncbi:hypothetical protein BpHYR1_051386 [Brachionus plicatilis]|uniref:Uncharacterized protein n=1 Tax=Brachionus plicatilis TaxID=10195 RepID=A0A3M7P210_BRAPC|nr:hypothetical protein BpHYR1_051386 [Brachionus plicatilis]
MSLVLKLRIPKNLEDDLKSMEQYFECDHCNENNLITELITNCVPSNELDSYVDSLHKSFENDDIRQKLELIKQGEQDTSNLVCFNRSWIENYNFYFLNVKKVNSQSNETIYKVVFFYYDHTLKPTLFSSCKSYFNILSSSKFTYNQLKCYFFFKFAEYAKKFCPSVNFFFSEEIKHLDLQIN